MTEALQFLDKLVQAKTGRPLTSLQRKIIEGTLNGQKYRDIIADTHYSEGHAKDVGSDLWQILSDIFKEPVTKKNLKSVIKKIKNVKIGIGDNSNINNIMGCINLSHQPFNKPQKNLNFIDDNTQTKINKLKQHGLTIDEIAEILEISLEKTNEQEN